MKVEKQQPSILLQQRADEVFCLVGNVFKTLRVKLVASGRHQSQSLGIAVPLKGGFSTQPGSQIKNSTLKS